MRVGFVLRSTEIKPLFWDLCEIERDSSFTIESHSTKYYPCGFYYSTWREKDVSDLRVWERREDRFLNMQNERETNAKQPPTPHSQKTLSLFFSLQYTYVDMKARRRDAQVLAKTSKKCSVKGRSISTRSLCAWKLWIYVAKYRIFLWLDHITIPTPALIRTPKLRMVEHSQYECGRPAWKPVCWVFFFFIELSCTLLLLV